MKRTAEEIVKGLVQQRDYTERQVKTVEGRIDALLRRKPTRASMHEDTRLEKDIEVLYKLELQHLGLSKLIGKYQELAKSEPSTLQVDIAQALGVKAENVEITTKTEGTTLYGTITVHMDKESEAEEVKHQPPAEIEDDDKEVPVPKKRRDDNEDEDEDEGYF